MWEIEIRESNPAQNKSEYVQSNPKERALEISKENPGKPITIWCFARSRMTIQDGEVVTSALFEDYYVAEERKEYIEGLVFNNLLPYHEFLSWEGEFEEYPESIETPEWKAMSDEEVKAKYEESKK